MTPPRRMWPLRTALLLAVAPAAAHADIIYNEAAQGDLSGDRFAPTPFVLDEGIGEFFGVMTGEDEFGNFDRDYWSFTIPEGFLLASILLDSYVSPDFAAFVAIQPGPVFPNDPETVMPGDLMGWTHFGPAQLGLDLLILMSVNGSGYSTPLPAGTYSFWGQQQADFTEYVLRVEVVPVPAPGGVGVAGLALGAILGPLSRRRR